MEEYDEMIPRKVTSTIIGTLTSNEVSGKVRVIMSPGGWEHEVLGLSLSCDRGLATGHEAALLYPKLTAQRRFYIAENENPR